MKIRLINKETYDVSRVDVVNGRLEIDFKDKPAEEIQTIFSNPAKLQNIELLDDDWDKMGDVPGWTVYGGVVLVGETKTVILTKEIDAMSERLTSAESNAMAANILAERAKALSEETAIQVTDLQLAMCEIYEGMEA